MKITHILIGLSILFATQILFYLNIIFYHQNRPFHLDNYRNNAHHYFTDPRVLNGNIDKEKFDLIRGLGQFDAQWYLKIADQGYPAINNMGSLNYAFFPLYPILLAFLNIPLQKLEMSAFFLSNLFIAVNFISLIIVISRLYDKELGFKTAFLLFFFPFAIFYRSYYPEGLFLFLLIWFSYFLIKRSWLYTSVFLSFLLVTKPQGIFISIVYLYFLIKDIKERKINSKKVLPNMFITSIPFSLWLVYNFQKTGNPFFWANVQKVWYENQSILFLIKRIILSIIHFPKLPFHSFHYSQVDILMIIIVTILLIYSRKFLKKELWLISLVLSLLPLLIKDTMSFSRYQIISFPLFLYLAYKLKGGNYLMILGIFLLTFLWLSLYFVNWFWVG